MAAILHIEPITRQTPTPLSVGHTDYLSYGDRLGEEGESSGGADADLRMGCPMEPVDCGSTRSHIPLVKTIEYNPDYSRPLGNVYSETIHYLTPRKSLVPLRTKIRSGMSQGLRFNHLPSLNYIRRDLSGSDRMVVDPRPDIVNGLFLKDKIFQDKPNHPLEDWLQYDLTDNLSKSQVIDMRLDTDYISQMIKRCSRQIHSTPSEINTRHLEDISSIISSNIDSLPPIYGADQAIRQNLQDFKNRMVPHGFDLRSPGRLPVERLPRIDYNPFRFQAIAEVLDQTPLTDLNVEVVVGGGRTIEFLHAHTAVDRIAAFDDADFGVGSPIDIVYDMLDGLFTAQLFESFIRYHTFMTPETERELLNYPTKIKITKTIADEALIQLFRHDSKAGEEPLCGVYFDLALQSLAPMSAVLESYLS